MAPKMRPARPLFGYRDTGGRGERHGREQQRRSWIILALLVVLYLGWTLTIFFIEPGLR